MSNQHQALVLSGRLELQRLTRRLSLVLLNAVAAGASISAGAVLADRSTNRSGTIQATAIAVVVSAAVVMAVAAVRQSRRGRVTSRNILPPPATDAAANLKIHPVDDAPFDETEVAAADSTAFDGSIVQRLIRSRTADGERVEGMLRATLLPHERNITLHVAFCPPLDETPRLSVRQISGPASRIKPAQILPYGLRLDLKRIAAATEAAEVVIAFSAVANSEAKV